MEKMRGKEGERQEDWKEKGKIVGIIKQQSTKQWHVRGTKRVIASERQLDNRLCSRVRRGLHNL